MKLRISINVLNLIITGIPSILIERVVINDRTECFKPYYNWNTFNTKESAKNGYMVSVKVLNLIITGIPSILSTKLSHLASNFAVLNLIITGIPSIPRR